MFRIIFSIMVCQFLLTSVVFAQEGETPTEQSQGVQLKVSESGNVTLDFRDADIRNVLKVLAYKSGTNIIAGPEVIGLVTINLKDVPWQRALDVILSTYGYGYEKKDSIIMVTTIENLKIRREDTKILEEQEPLSTQTYLLNFSKAEEVSSTIQAMLTARGSLNSDLRTNTLVVRDTESNLGNIGEVIKYLDAITPQVLIEAKIVKTTLNDDEKLGIDWGMELIANGASRQTIWPFTVSSNNKYFPGDLAGGNILTAGSLSATGLKATLQMLSTRIDTDVISNPRIVTMNNKTAKITVGEQYPIPNYTYNEETSDLQVSGFEWRDIGVSFEVTPHVNGPDYITIDVKPVVSSRSETPAKFSTDFIPVIETEEAETSVMIRHGETLMIAGLIKQVKSKTMKKLPILGDIPLLGLLFRHKFDSDDKTELIIFITPTIITPTISGDVVDTGKKSDL